MMYVACGLPLMCMHHLQCRLPTGLLERVQSAVTELRFEATVGEVAARAGVKLSDADDALKVTICVRLRIEVKDEI